MLRKQFLYPVLLLSQLSTFAQTKNCFVLGSSQGAVRKLQGNPESIYKHEDGKETWSYGKSSITFKTGLVDEYDNYGKNLRLCKEVVPVVTKEEQEKQGYLQPMRSKSKATKQATQDWILEKLNQYVNKDIFIEGYYSVQSGTQYPGRHIKNTSFNFEGTALVIRYKVDDPRDPHEESYTIPIHDLKRLHNDGSKLVLSSRTNSMTHTVGRQTNKVNNYSVQFDFQSEADIKARLVSAFSHLQKFYKGPQKKETF
jgi:hypothetical protein